MSRPLLLLPFIALLAAAPALAQEFRVVDGDTLAGPGGERFALSGLDAPEADQSCERAGRVYPCGAEAAGALERLVAGKRVTCERQGRDEDGRTRALCYAGGRDLGKAMVRAGWAVVDRRRSRAYVIEEDDARAAGRGLWAGCFVDPWDWRRGTRLEGC